ncbi:hypothetical protein SERLA73DRAFT_68268 [Serpula lacrymans var. lacrymans S7.3]|uniref:CCHC-type domain-containing protein n=2 Tax=Serpula lacrymans var. lacrymans TaxID=341189 RepID=F8PHU9_SERL3|nr:uncharacterized protein SERLADRAFT_432011 [Serpula lacrymans var. lacrymans S7.9]EGO04578.1 hypothetical protein SERLA73DRAFT_68268 [Serpula lacrymans var. lacrymans S7.3]EGO30453.1 hypothetical protein SERLADRAFT_432011 [Serpula lacrymans var. lacrymans S7.9]
MLLQSQPDVNTLLHNMHAQILALTTQLAELQVNPAAATPSVEKKFHKKVKVVADPGAFEGDREQFTEWWIKLQIWVKANWDAFADNFEECYTAGVWLVWDDLKVENKKYFKPQAERDWARQQIRSFKQGNMRTDHFVTWFLALSIQGGLGNEHAVELLERNVNPHITEQLYLQDMRSDNLSQSNHSHGLQPGRGAPIDIGVVQGGQKRRFTCFSCGQEGHMARDCTNRVRATHQKNNQGRQARQLETEKPDNQLYTLAGRSYDEIRAFFYDQQVNKMKAQGKEFGA